ncbi:hypothetical protein FB45DRAFT_879120 [Roridomyces roridus]|uniref:Uncharacterized protein n=1 Tax=Roridomyces roridus TaxID=1738132 RepID=A0AAD7F6V7_9AGAR|nr:hypothetical protein FB45DRAFT_879120 [Roridomyces roridus]
MSERHTPASAETAEPLFTHEAARITAEREQIMDHYSYYRDSEGCRHLRVAGLLRELIIRMASLKRPRHICRLEGLDTGWHLARTRPEVDIPEGTHVPTAFVLVHEFDSVSRGFIRNGEGSAWGIERIQAAVWGLFGGVIGGACTRIIVFEKKNQGGSTLSIHSKAPYICGALLISRENVKRAMAEEKAGEMLKKYWTPSPLDLVVDKSLGGWPRSNGFSAAHPRRSRIDGIKKAHFTWHDQVTLVGN